MRPGVATSSLVSEIFRAIEGNHVIYHLILYYQQYFSINS